MSLTKDNSAKVNINNAMGALKGLTYQKIPGDGHCLFRAVSLYLGQDVQSLRDSVARYLEENHNEFADFYSHETIPFNQHIDAIHKGNEWATHIEIEAIQRLNDRPIIIIRHNDNPTIPDNLSTYKGDPIFVYYNGHNHYDAFTIEDGIDAKTILTEIQAQIALGNRVTYNPNSPVSTKKIDHDTPLTVTQIIDEFKNYVEGDLFINKLLFPVLSRKHVELANKIINELNNNMTTDQALQLIVEKISEAQKKQKFDSKSLFFYLVNNIFNSHKKQIDNELRKLKKKPVAIASPSASLAPSNNNNSSQMSEQTVTQYILATGYYYLYYLTAGISEPVIDYFTGNSKREQDLQKQKATALSVIMKSSTYDVLLENIKKAKDDQIFKNEKASFENLEIKMNDISSLTNIDDIDPELIKQVTREYIVLCIDPNNKAKIKELTASYKLNVAHILVSLKPETRVVWAARIFGIIVFVFSLVICLGSSNLLAKARHYQYSSSSLLESYVLKRREDKNQNINAPQIDTLIDDFEDKADDLATSVTAIRPSA